MRVRRVRVILVDDHAVVRRGLRRILELDKEVDVVGEAQDGRAALEQVLRLRPDVVVMDLGLPELNGIEATHQITRRHPRTQVVVLTMHADEISIRRALKAGARGYVLKDADHFELAKAIKVVARGSTWFSPTISGQILDGFLQDGARAEETDMLARLTVREREVLQLIAEARTSKEIADRLAVSISTVETHRKNIMEKLALRNTAEVVRFAVEKAVVR